MVRKRKVEGERKNGVGEKESGEGGEKKKNNSLY
jgi:hypothetical protein